MHWRIIVAFLLAVVLFSVTPASSHPFGPLGTNGEQCGGVAPTVTTCNTGPHIRTVTVRHELYMGEVYTGVVVSVLQPQPPLDQFYGVHRIACLVQNGTAIDCFEEGFLPPRFVRFDQSCDSFADPGTGNARDAVQGGGTGFWGCAITHD